MVKHIYHMIRVVGLPLIDWQQMSPGFLVLVSIEQLPRGMFHGFSVPNLLLQGQNSLNLQVRHHFLISLMVDLMTWR
jgi:hypothetical protein